jgi:thiol-disulfide isomerase/thioredoxin
VRGFAARPSVLLVAGLLCAGCGAGRRIPTDARTTIVSLRGADCAGCGDNLVTKLKMRPGVYDASFDKRKAELRIVAAPATDAYAEAKRLADPGEGYELLLGEGQGMYKAWAKPPEGADVRTVNEAGADVPDLGAIVVRGKVTVVDFGALWCEPCRALDEHVLGVMKARPDVAYRKLDVGDWDTPIAKRYLKNVPALPYVIVFDKRGSKVDAVSGLDLARIDAAIEKGAR